MKALTLTQPWATLVAIGAKRIETRSWSTSYRGPLAIHAAKGFPREAKELCGSPLFHEALYAAGYDIGLRSWDILPRGAVIATCRLVDCQRTDLFSREGYGSAFALSKQEYAFGDYSEGRWAWTLAKIEPITPFQVKGALGLWECGDV